MEKKKHNSFTNGTGLKVGTPEYKKFRTWLWESKGFHTTMRAIKPEYLTEWLNEYKGLALDSDTLNPVKK